MVGLAAKLPLPKEFSNSCKIPMSQPNTEVDAGLQRGKINTQGIVMSDGGSDAEHIQLSLKHSKKSKTTNGGLDLAGLIERLGDSGKKIDPGTEILLLRVSDYLKDRLRRQEDEFTEQIHELEKELERERQKRRDAERNEEARIRSSNQISIRDRKDLGRSLKSMKRGVGGALAVSMVSLMIVGGLEIRRLVSSEVEAVTVEQLEERVGSYDTALLAREKQLGEVVDSKTAAVLAEVEQLKKRVDDTAEFHQQTSDQIRSFMVARNDDTGMMNKIVDSYNYAVELMQYFSKTESERMEKEIKEYRAKLEERKQKIEKETEQNDE